VLVHARTEEDTAAIGGRLADAFPRDVGTFVVVQLHGELGAGKTTLARGFLRALGVTGPVRSPTYTLVELYELPAAAPGLSQGQGLTAVHLDLYRLSDPSELEPLGLSEWARPQHVWLVEWPERGGDRLPPADLDITLEALADGHRIALSAQTPIGEAWIKRLE
jgi:tRNA threonylcarbamoyladenosine biosynthesis protein TsaE